MTTRVAILCGAALCAFVGLTGCGGDLADLPALGTLERDRIELVAESNEPIVAIDVKEGDLVAADQVLLRLDDALISVQIAQAQANRDELRARLAEAERGPRAERIREARARLAGAESTARNAEAEYGRARSLQQKSYESDAARDQRQARRDEAIAARNGARANLDQLESGTTSEELDQLRAALASSDARVAELEIRHARLTLRAPRAGIVDALPFELGERPPLGALVAVLLASERPYARVYVPEALRARIAIGSRARVTIAGRDGALDARVRTLAHEAAFTPYYALTQYDRGRLAYLAEVDLEAGEGVELPTGVPVEVRFALDAGAAQTAASK